ncbi:protein FAR1-RELATED SEQUENCE 5-like [Chenopodium quinoa]|uniref:protein FAR1-RELATED SEQUENCE 5-like n=1 Tax=Chenopodium quinoa TaxID=63459 RepID=UPI000B774397|nr:protein FAR1-RELATED SEQUENCE 5-like [Chenopodium quinoa]
MWFDLNKTKKRPNAVIKLVNRDSGTRFGLSSPDVHAGDVNVSILKTPHVVLPRTVYNSKGGKEFIPGAVFRKKTVRRIGSPAMIKFKYCDGGKYMVYFFHESHCHPFSTPTTRQVTKPYDGLTCVHRKFIFDNSKLNIGVVMSYRMMKEYCGGYKHVRGTKNQFKNFSHGLKVYISEADGAMFIENLQQKVKNSNGCYYLDYCVDATRHLTRVFWTDPIGRKDFHLFRDSISFDTTYDTKKYSLVFCPFTGVDHDKRCVTFCAALLSKEDVESFVWIFQTFLKCMGNETSCLIIDQNPAMGIAIQKVFTKTKH